MGVDKSASNDEIKKSYRKLAKKFHPDVSKEKDASARFKEINEAYEVLRDKEKRNAYDQLGSDWQQGQSGFTPPPNWQGNYGRSNAGFNTGDEGQYSDFFDALFGARGNRQSAQHSYARQGQDSQARVLIDLREAYTGVERSFTLQDQIRDENGQVRPITRTLKVKIPKGIKPGQKIRLQNQGGAGAGGAKNGDLFIEVGFNPHALFTVEGSAVTTELAISPWQAALGEKVQVPTPIGTFDLSLPKVVSSGTKLRVKGRGLPSKISGDFFVKLKITFPTSLSSEEEALYQSLKALKITTKSEVKSKAEV